MAEDSLIKSPLNKTYRDKFLFTFNLPEALKDLSNEYNMIIDRAGINKSTIDFSLISASIPGHTIKGEDVQYGGGHLYISTHTKDAYEPVSISFKIDSHFANYYVLYSWMNLIWNEQEGHYNADNLAKGKSINDYQAKMSIVALDEYNKPTIQWLFTRAFPTSLSSVEFNYQQTEEIDCSATFLFSQMITRNLAIEKIKNAKHH